MEMTETIWYNKYNQIKIGVICSANAELTYIEG